MLTSIRWRLVMGAMLLTLLTVSAVGVVALLLMQGYMAQQERAYLKANAEAIAKQAGTFMSPVKVPPPLQQLAQTAAFLGDVTVRIVDDARMPVADSALAMPYAEAIGMPAAPLYFRVASQPHAYTDAVVPASPNGIWTTSTKEFTLITRDPFSSTVATSIVATAPGSFPEMGYEANVIMVQKSPSIWGDRLTFEAQAGMPVAEPVPVAETMPFEYSVAPVEPWVAGAAVQPGEAAFAVAEGDVTQSTAPSFGATKAKEGQWQIKKLLAWNRNEEYAEISTVAAEPNFLQLAGFQSTDVVTAPIMTGDMVVGFVELGRTTDLVDEPLGAIRRALGIAAGASALMAIAVGLVMSHTLTSPIQNLAQAAAAMSSGDLTARAPVVGRDELASLAHQFNQMADALHRTFEELAAERDTLRRFVADASHELRTPITALRTFNELLQGPAQADREAQIEFLAESHAQIARLEWITRNLLDLSRWDGGMATLVIADVEMGDLVTSAVTPFRALALERQIDLKMVLPETPIVAQVDEQRLGMAVGNLLDNALKFTPDAGKVEVGVSQDEEGIKVWVEDTGMGIGAEDLPHIFARFYRSPRATQTGSGLGLAIVERIVDAHGATIRVESAEGVGSRFTLCMGVT